MNGWPDDESLAERVLEWRGARAFELPIEDSSGRPFGNNGDVLMQSVYRRMLDEYRIELVEDVLLADFLIVPPNGAMLDRYQFPRLLRERLRLLPDLPLVIFPSSAFFDVSDPARIFDGRISETVWILREKLSYQHLESMWGQSLRRAGVSLALSHDVVSMGGGYVNAIFSEFSGTVNDCSSLVVGRLDGEGALGFGQQSSRSAGTRRAIRAMYRHVPGSMRRMARRRATRERQAVANRDLVSALDVLDRSTFAKAIRSRNSVDLSDPNIASFDDYANAIAGSRYVVTNRLHVALPSAQIGKETYLVDSGYHKLRGVFEHSLTGVANLKFVSLE